MEKVKNILTISAIIAVVVSAIILVMIILEVGSSVEMQESLIKVLQIIGVFAATAMVIVGIINLSSKK